LKTRAFWSLHKDYSGRKRKSVVDGMNCTWQTRDMQYYNDK
jgi:hypothetical protein